ncbi:Uncharacterised protein [Mycobacteroides abscessus subsp. abscessus]|nr:Uncharacterised protein [Mycobacteroides abscessus subsp. abscessus]
MLGSENLYGVIESKRRSRRIGADTIFAPVGAFDEVHGQRLVLGRVVTLDPEQSTVCVADRDQQSGLGSIFHQEFPNHRTDQ